LIFLPARFPALFSPANAPPVWQATAFSHFPGFLQSGAVDMLVAEAEAQKHNAYFTASSHNVYLSEPRPDLDASHVFNRQIISSKGCITTDQVPEQSEAENHL
jgi:hypothetical protein